MYKCPKAKDDENDDNDDDDDDDDYGIGDDGTVMSTEDFSWHYLKSDYHGLYIINKRCLYYLLNILGKCKQYLIVQHRFYTDLDMLKYHMLGFKRVI